MFDVEQQERYEMLTQAHEAAEKLRRELGQGINWSLLAECPAQGDKDRAAAVALANECIITLRSIEQALLSEFGEVK